MSATTAILLLSLRFSGPPPDLESLRSNLPSWARSTVEGFESQRRVALSNRLSPHFLEGDFNGDGQDDLAVLVSGTEHGKDGILIVFRDQSKVVLVGAGVPFGNGGDDFSWMDVWSVLPKGPIERGAGEGPPPTLRGDALLVEKSESASALIYWNGKMFRWHQQGD